MYIYTHIQYSSNPLAAELCNRLANESLNIPNDLVSLARADSTHTRPSAFSFSRNVLSLSIARFHVYNAYNTLQLHLLPKTKFSTLLHSKLHFMPRCVYVLHEFIIMLSFIVILLYSFIIHNM